MVQYWFGGYGLGPVVQLQLWGMACPCLEKEEDRAARQSLQSLQHCLVLWHPNNNNNNRNNSVTSLVVDFFKKNTTTTNNNNGDNKNAIWAKLLIIDHATNGPTLQISPIPTTTTNNNNHHYNDDDDDDTTSTNHTDPSSSSTIPTSSAVASFMKCIPLRQVKQVQQEKKEGSTIVLLDDNQQVLVRLDLYKQSQGSRNGATTTKSARTSSSSSSVAPSSAVGCTTAERNEVVDALSMVVHWVQRLPMTDEEASSASPDNLSIRNRAQQAAHFAQREIELQQKKREREKRKAGYLEQSKGLKYTALAMANRNTTNE